MELSEREGYILCCLLYAANEASEHTEQHYVIAENQ